jgi:hypothetical protein
MGPSSRGGAFTYDWIENLLGLNTHSAESCARRVPAPGGRVTSSRRAQTGCLERVDPARALAWRAEDGNWVWTFVLRGENGSTRLISRNRFRLPTLAAQLGMPPMEPASLVME